MSTANQDPLSLPDWMRRQLDHATAVEHGEANERRGIVLGGAESIQILYKRSVPRGPPHNNPTIGTMAPPI